MNIFEEAVKQKLRFSTPKGNLSVEDLFDLPLSSTTGKTNLDDIARGLHLALKNETEVSFVEPRSRKASVLDLQFEVVKSVIASKMAENAAENLRRKNSEKRQKIMELIAAKEDEAVKGLPLEELQKMLDSLG